MVLNFILRDVESNDVECVSVVRFVICALYENIKAEDLKIPSLILWY